MTNYTNLIVEAMALHTQARAKLVLDFEDRSIQFEEGPALEWCWTVSKAHARTIGGTHVETHWEACPEWRVRFPLPLVRTLPDGYGWVKISGEDADALAEALKTDLDAMVHAVNGDAVVLSRQLPVGAKGYLEPIGDGMGLKIAPSVVLAIGALVDET